MRNKYSIDERNPRSRGYSKLLAGCSFGIHIGNFLGALNEGAWSTPNFWRLSKGHR